MLFENKPIKYLKYSKNEKTKQRHFTLKCETLENINELISVFNKENPNLRLTSNLLANIIFENFFKEFEKLTDQDKLLKIKHEVLNQIQ